MMTTPTTDQFQLTSLSSLPGMPILFTKIDCIKVVWFHILLALSSIHFKP